ncbi:alpha/beta hydrolase [Natrarchaeobius sp. A-rgal3]|uniref:alpha/beta hydrolase n=1 Tax=Natrarchaeobius versutus TaxID=1679078 RepID=UPI00350EFBCE
MRASEPHPEVQAVLEQMADAPAFRNISVEEARAAVAESFGGGGPEAAETVTDRTVSGPAGEIPIRIYEPEGEGPFPVVTFFHGGGFVVGGLDGHDVLCSELADGANVVVVSVDYRLAPEHEFPAAVEDAYAATEWVAENAAEFGGDPDRHAVAGDSAGGNLAAVVSLMAREQDGPDIAHQLLLYPTVSYVDQFDSHEEFAEGYFLETEDGAYFAELYLGNELHGYNPYASPLRAASHEDLPPATILTGGFDPVRDEGIAYAETLEEAGVDVTHLHYDDVIHIFLQMADEPFELTRAQEAIDDVTDELADAL